MIRNGFDQMQRTVRDGGIQKQAVVGFFGGLHVIST